MFIPIRSDRTLRSTPYVNYALIVVNVVVFMATLGAMDRAHVYYQQQYESLMDQRLQALIGERMQADGPIAVIGERGGIDETLSQQAEQEAADIAERRTSERFLAYRLMLHKNGTLVWQFLSYQFMHGSIMHLVGNMIFLWVFGNNVEDRLGKVGYLFFFLCAGVLAGLGHWLTSDAPVLGASGSVAGVTGAFLALFPRTRIGFVYFFMIIGFFEVPAMVVVLFFFAKDVLLQTAGAEGVAYTAHIAGTLTGFALGMGLLLTRILPREPYDLLTLIEHRRRRDKFRKIAKKGYQPWEGKLAGQGMAQPVGDPAVHEARREIAKRAAEHDLPAAAARYAELLKDHPDQALNERLQTDLSNQLATSGDFASAAHAYELLLKTYPRHPQKPDLQLMLGLIYARYLGQPALAKTHLNQAAQRLTGEPREHALELLAALG